MNNPTNALVTRIDVHQFVQAMLAAIFMQGYIGVERNAALHSAFRKAFEQLMAVPQVKLVFVILPLQGGTSLVLESAFLKARQDHLITLHPQRIEFLFGAESAPLLFEKLTHLQPLFIEMAQALLKNVRGLRPAQKDAR